MIATTILRVAAITSFLAAKATEAANTAAPNDAIDKPGCYSSITVSIRYSPLSVRLYLESDNLSTSGGCITLTEILWEFLNGSSPLYVVDSDSSDVSETTTGAWLHTEDLYVENGVTLKVNTHL